jgi:hypothetical protein
MVLMHLKKYGSITHLEAETQYGIARLAARINDLRKQGHDIRSERVMGRNRRDEPAPFARYRLVEDEA